MYQGESADVRRNHRIGKFMIEGLSRGPAGNQIVVQLDLTLDGVLKVAAREKTTGLTKHITIDNAMARFAVEEREAARERMDQLWTRNEEGEEIDGDGELSSSDSPMLAPGPQEGQRETVQARALLEKAERLLSKSAPDDRVELERLVSDVRTALEDRRWEELTTATNALTDVLFYLEDA